MENSLEPKNRGRETSKKSGGFFFPLLLNLEGKAAFFFSSAVKSEVPYKMEEI